MLKFEQLKVWQKALDLTMQIHDLTRGFPKEELYVLTAQIKRAADSIALNIAEGSTSQSNAEFRQFLGYAVRSAIEVIACLHIGQKRKLITAAEVSGYSNQAEEILRMLHGLRRSLK